MSAGYEEACASHRWAVPERYNIAADVCDKHPREKLAMVWESFDGSYRELSWGELQDLANQAAHTLAAQGVERGDRVAVVLPRPRHSRQAGAGAWPRPSHTGQVRMSSSRIVGVSVTELNRPAPRHWTHSAARTPRETPLTPLKSWAPRSLKALAGSTCWRIWTPTLEAFFGSASILAYAA